MGKGTLRTGPPGGFEQVERADSVDIEIVEGSGGSKVVAGLCGGVDNGGRLELGDELQDFFTVADIQLVMFEVLKIFFPPYLLSANSYLLSSISSAALSSPFSPEIPNPSTAGGRPSPRPWF